MRSYKSWQNSQENTCAEILFNKVASWGAATFLKQLVGKEHLGKIASDIGMLFSDFWRARIIIWLKYFQAISPNYTNQESVQTRFSCLIFLKVHACISIIHLIYFWQAYISGKHAYHTFLTCIYISNMHIFLACIYFQQAYNSDMHIMYNISLKIQAYDGRVKKNTSKITMRIFQVFLNFFCSNF